MAMQGRELGANTLDKIMLGGENKGQVKMEGPGWWAQADSDERLPLGRK